MTPPPPTPVRCGATAARQKEAATAASTALPPVAMTRSPTSVQFGWSDAVASAECAEGETPAGEKSRTKRTVG